MNLKKFSREEKKEIKKLVSGKENISIFFSRTKKHFRDFFIPHEGNSHKPKSLHTKTLALYVLLAIFIKLAGTTALFALYPSGAKLAQILSREIIEYTNFERQKIGVPPLRVNDVLSGSALLKGEDMMQRDYFAHDTPEGKKPWFWIDRKKYDYVYAGENLAMDFTSSEFVHKAFMKSPTHQKNILNDKYLDMGVAVVLGEMFGHETQLLVEFFGTKRSDLALLPRAPGTQLQGDVKKSARAEAQKISKTKPLVLGSENKIKTLSERSRSADQVVFLMNTIFLGILIFLVLCLILNIIIKFHIQHSSVIMQALAVIALISILLISRLHFIQQIPAKMSIL